MGMKLYVFLLGRLAILNGVALAIPFLCAVMYGESLSPFAWPLGVTLCLGALLQQLGANHKKQLDVLEGAIYLTSVWIMLGIIGMMPYVISGLLPPVDALFESLSAYTTTGSSCIPVFNADLSRSIALWYSIMEWMGGFNFIIMVVTVIPQVSGCFGVTLSAQQSIAFSPMVKRMRSMARQAFYVYVGVTIVSALLFFLAGLPWFEAITQAMTTTSTSGGTTSFDFSRYDSIYVEGVTVVSMLFASCNFLLYWKACSRRSPVLFFRDTEWRTFLLIFVGASCFVVFHLWHTGYYDLAHSFRYGIFAVASFLSTTGYANTPIATWPEFDRYALFLLAFVGGCIGSAAGGLRIMRVIVLFKMAAREMRRTLHPRMMISVKINGIPVAIKIISRVLSYFCLFVFVFFFSMLVISLSGVSLLEAMGIALGCLSSVGSTAELFGVESYASLPVWTKLYCSFLMIIGRIEIFSFLIIIQAAWTKLRSNW